MRTEIGTDLPHRTSEVCLGQRRQPCRAVMLLEGSKLFQNALFKPLPSKLLTAAT